MLRELSTGECEALLSRARVGRIAVRDAEGAYIVHMSFVYDGGVIHAQYSQLSIHRLRFDLGMPVAIEPAHLGGTGGQPGWRR